MKRLLAMLLLLAACSGEQPAPQAEVPAKPKTPPPPTVAQAREILANAPELGEFEFTHAGFSLPMDKALRNEPANDAVKRLSKAQWIALDGDGRVILTPKSRDDKRFLVRPNGVLDIVPLAKKELGDVTAVRPNPDGTAAADFAWTWIPNEVGQSLKERYEGTQNATATLMWDGTNWIVLRIERP